MPVHDWSKAEKGTFHSFHVLWIAEIANTMNRGLLPAGFYAMAERFMGKISPDVLTFSSRPIPSGYSPHGNVGTLMSVTRPKALLFEEASEETIQAFRANRIAVRNPEKQIVAAIELVSPGNKSNQKARQKFIRKSVQLIDSGIHLLVIDVLPPTRMIPNMHAAIWNRISGPALELPPGKDRLLASYEADELPRAYVEPLAVGDELQAMPLFLETGRYIEIPLEETYRQAWENFPETIREGIE